MRKTFHLDVADATRLAVILMAALSICAMAATIQDLGVSEVTLPPPTPADVSPSYEEITAEAWEGRGLSAAEILSALPGIQSYKQGGLGSFQTVSIRGIAAKNILICLDGIPLNDASGGAVDLGSIDLNSVEKIEIYKDRVPIKFGGSGLGGVVNFVTKKALPALKGRILASYGSHNTWEGAAQVAISPKDSVHFSAAISARHSDNDYEFTNRNGTAYNSDDDFTDTRKNAEFSEYSGNFQYRILHSNNLFSTVSAHLIYTEAGNPGHESSQTKVADFVGQYSQLGYRLEFPILWNCFLLETGVVADFEKNISSSYYPLDNIGYSNSDYVEYGLAGYRLHPEIQGSVILGKIESSFRLAGSAESWGARGSVQDYGITRYSGSFSAGLDIAIFQWLSALAEGSFVKNIDEIDGGKLLSPTGTISIEESKDREMNASAFAQLRFGKKESLWGGHISVGRFFREPQLMELYGVYRGVLSNPDLKNETAIRFESGGFLQTPSRKTIFRAVWFSTFLENGIYWASTVNAMKAYNASTARIYGVELEMKSRPVSFFETVLRGTIQNPRDRGHIKMYSGNLLPGEPVHSYFVEGKFFLPFGLDLTFDVNYRSRIFSDRINQTRQPATARYNAALGFSPWEKMRFIFGITNISDETFTHFYSPYPVPGREYKISWIQKF